MTIPIRVKLLTKTAKAPEQSNEGDLLDLFADGFEIFQGNTKGETYFNKDEAVLFPLDRILVKTGISLELPVQLNYGWSFKSDDVYLGEGSHSILAYAVADLRPRSGLALKHGITVLNAPATIDNSYRKEIGVILINHGHEPYTIRKGDKIAQMLIRPLYPNKMEIVENIEDTGRNGYGSTGK
jgi:dUTPase